MDAKKHYETYWNNKKKRDDFFSYERNEVLPLLFNKTEKVLDLGGGDGAVAEYLQNELGMKVVAADISDKALEVAKKRGLETKKVDVEKKLPFKSATFDTVFWGDNVEHLFEPEFTLKEIRRVLKKDGRIILSCPNMGYWRYRLHYFLNGSLPDTEWTGNPPWGWSHIRFFNFKIMKEFLNANKFKEVSFHGVSKRDYEKLLRNALPSLFSMIMVVTARK